MENSKEKTLNESRVEFYTNLNKGIDCPCCDRFGKRYKWNMNQIMARGLINLVKQYQKTKDYVHCHDIRFGDRDVRVMGGQFALLLHWGLIQEKINEDTEKRCSGFWKPTENGILFVFLKIKTNKYVFTYNDKCEGKSEELIDIREALGKKFSYSELMGYTSFKIENKKDNCLNDYDL